MGVLIDADVLINAEKGRFDVFSRVKGREDDEFLLSAVTASELLHGVWRAPDPRVRARRSAFVEEVLRQFPILPLDLPVARTHAQLWAELEKKGAAIGSNDLWVAASCVAHGHSLATGNVVEFRRVPGLMVERWL